MQSTFCWGLPQPRLPVAHASRCARTSRCRLAWDARKLCCAQGVGSCAETLDEAWQVVSSGQTLSVAQRAMLWLASTHAAIAAKEATELMFSAGGASSPYTNAGLERCMRDILAAAQHLTVAPANYQMVGQALLGSDMRATPLLFMDDRGVP